MQEKLDAWDPSKADDVQYLMSMAKKYVVLDTLVANGGKCTYEVLFARSEELHCDVLAAALKSLKKSKAVSYEGRAQSPSNHSALRHISRVSRVSRVSRSLALAQRCC